MNQNTDLQDMLRHIRKNRPESILGLILMGIVGVLIVISGMHKHIKLGYVVLGTIIATACFYFASLVIFLTTKKEDSS